MKTCAVPECGKPVPRSMLMCPHHWFMVPRNTRNRIWVFYNHSDFGIGYEAAVRDAVQAVLDREMGR